MASAIASTLKRLTSALQALGIFDEVATVEPKRSPGTGLFAAVFLASMEMAERSSGLNRADGLYVFTLRLYKDMLQEPAAEIDPQLAGVADLVFDALAVDFDLGGTIRAVDFFGIHGTKLRAEAGYIDLDSKMFRVLDISVPLVVDNAFSAFVA